MNAPRSTVQTNRADRSDAANQSGAADQSDAANQSGAADQSDAAQLAIDATDVHVTYDDGTEAVCGVNLSVSAGEFFGFLGPNGAGKTTTIKTLAALLRPNLGSVSINGFDIENDSKAVRESIGYMAQETSVDEALTARENVRFACDIYGVPAGERDERVDELLALVNLTHVADKRAENFSGGMKKRLDAATVLVHRPPVVFLDEPTTGLDPEARIRFWEYLRSINERGTTVVLTTQYLEEVDRLCDRLAVIQDGEIIATDTPDALKSRVGGDIIELALDDPAARTTERATRIVRESNAFEAATIETTDRGLIITSEHAREAVTDLFVSLDDADITVTGLDIRSPTLDDVFLSITGERSNSSDLSPQHGVTSMQEVSK
ncbi:daunorubicin resistance ABC transporter ATP-binding subunit [Halogeometricum borinquense DSM 11551]|uniref:Daunorubicin resistance ABC transporter ATP-binding subunit n=1 Tax=Halogeometricum borinquense (strain ATCC 700274 / DSM 11551 / JCM 10706 / KCTC 4070 / PR3) TaxID=469382 RepID=E4NKS1_HALBP|nr:ABC transporter ATP-binding protein [Halogeometricum borinquense]ADQ65967.1 daunorubicin resistance ABC transporter ATP-binding subunit [Halogeometricum borinquense DSM 11551]ELY23123.1 daunorubicin resistance ABC transporter ATP-binding subunit [Halogeometricum borinquense DSM 11551]